MCLCGAPHERRVWLGSVLPGGQGADDARGGEGLDLFGQLLNPCNIAPAGIGQRDAGLPESVQEALASIVRSQAPYWRRSEEHTSELQSRPQLVCRLQLEKKKNTASGDKFSRMNIFFSTSS